MGKNSVILTLLLGMVIFQPIFSLAEPSRDYEKLAAANKEALENSEWNIVLMPLGKKGREEGDVIIFSNGRVASRNLQNSGFAPSGFTVRMKGGKIIWETMQKDGKGGVAFWRGDIENDLMRGALSMQDAKGKVTKFSFVSK